MKSIGLLRPESPRMGDHKGLLGDLTVRGKWRLHLARPSTAVADDRVRHRRRMRARGSAAREPRCARRTRALLTASALGGVGSVIGFAAVTERGIELVA